MQPIAGIALAAVLLLLAPSGAVAQAPDGHFHVSFGAGPTVPNSGVRDRLGNGYNILFAVEYDMTPLVSIEGFLSTNNLGDKELPIPVSTTPFTPPTTREFSAS